MSTSPLPTPTAERSHRKPALVFIFITVLLDVLGFGLLIPVSPKLVMSLMPHGTDEAAAAPYYGWLAATYAVMQFVFTPVLGALSDRFGRRPVLLISIFGSGIDYLAGAMVPTLGWLFVTRAINGISGATISVCNASIADVTAPEKRAGAFGVIGAAFGLGFILGPFLGGVLGEMDLRYPFYAAGALSLCNWLYGYFVLPESLPPEKRAKGRASWKGLNPLAVAVRVRRYPSVLRLALSFFFLYFAMFVLHATWVLYTSKRYGWSARQTGLSLALVGLGAAVVQGGLARKVIPLLGERRAMLLGLSIGVLAYAGYGLATEGWVIYVVVLAASLGGISGPAGQSLITRSVSPTEQGAVQGSLTALQNLASILAFLIGPQIFKAFAGPETPEVLHGMSMFFSSALSLVGLVVAWWAVHDKHKAAGGAVTTGTPQE